MFFYVTGVKSAQEADWAIQNGANAIGVQLGYRQSALQAENCRTWLETLPFYIMKAGIFEKESYYDVEELASFCHLDIIHLRDTAAIDDFSRYSGRLLAETTNLDVDVAAQKAHGCLLRAASVAEAKEALLRKTEKPLLLSGDFSVQDWQSILAFHAPVGIAVDIAFAEAIAKLITCR